jgi:acetyl-CoA C-acetyltransferase
MLVRDKTGHPVRRSPRAAVTRRDPGLGAAPAPKKESSNMGAAEPLVFDAIRTPRGRGKVNGSLHTVKPVDLVVGLIHETLARNYQLDPEQVDDVVLGCVSPLGDQGADIAKTAAIKAGLPDTVAGVQLNRFCASGLEAVNIAAQKVASGWEDLVMAGGVESMSRVPMGSDGGPWALDPETNYDSSYVPQGVGADLIATVEGFTRDDVDAYAARSQERASAAQANGLFAGAVIPVLDINDNVVLDRDEHIRAGTTVESLARLKPSFASVGEMGGFDAVALQKYHWLERIEHVHTAGNSSGIVDGASLVLIGNERTGIEHGLTPTARIVATAVSGADPTIMLTGPAPASRKALARACLSVEDLDLVEINEAFAAVVLRFVRDMGLDMDRVNVNGGAIAMGHPLGATGGMILGTLIEELHRTGGRYGLATLCVAGGMGIATVVEAI